MPIKFRCQHCRQFLGISRTKAGELVDCPTCGRTLRVPKLDGTVEPVPDPKLNLEDAELAGALDALAMIGQDDPEAAADPEQPALAAKPAVVEVAAPAPKPIVVEAPIPAEPVVREAPAPQTPEPAATISSVDELAALAAQAKQEIQAGPAMSPKPVSARGATSPWKHRGVLAALAGIALLAAAIGYFVGNSRRDSAKEPAPSDANASQAKNPQNARTGTAAEDRTVAIRGQITYRSSDDRRPPDAGARILVFPVERAGQATVSIAGFWANAEEADKRISLAGIRALGGDATTADKDGKYTIQLPPSDGNYYILVISSFHQRDSDSRLTAGEKTLLTQYFTRPDAMIKQLSYKRDRIHFNGSEVETFNHVFE